MRLAIVVLATCIAVSTGAANAEAIGKRITRPDWAIRPTGDQMYNALSHSARAEEASGWALVRCDVDVKGRLHHCLALAEAPEHYEFGKAALKVMPIFRMKPTAKDGQSTAGGRVLVPLVWRMPGKGAPRRSYAPGSPTFLLKPMTEKKPGATVIPCPMAGDRPVACEAEEIYWGEGPSLEETAPTVLEGGQNTGASTVYCQVVEGKSLQNCQMDGERGAAAVTVVGKTLAKLRMPRRMDGTPVNAGVVVLVYDWPTLTTAAKAVVTADEKQP